MLIRPIIVLFVSVLSVAAAEISSVRCSVGPSDGALTSTGDSNLCYLVGGAANNTVSVDGQARQLSSQTMISLSASLSMFEMQYDAAHPETLNFSASASDSGTFVTAGPARLGYIHFHMSDGQPSFGVAAAGISDGVHTYVQGPCQSASVCSDGSEVIAPFELGTTFTVKAMINAAGQAFYSNTDAFSSGAAVAIDGLYEADGTTRVKLSSAPWGTPEIAMNLLTPEPTSSALLGAGLMVIGAAAQKRRRMLRLSEEGNGDSVRDHRCRTRS